MTCYVDPILSLFFGSHYQTARFCTLFALRIDADTYDMQMSCLGVPMSLDSSYHNASHTTRSSLPTSCPPDAGSTTCHVLFCSITAWYARTWHSPVSHNVRTMQTDNMRTVERKRWLDQFVQASLVKDESCSENKDIQEELLQDILIVRTPHGRGLHRSDSVSRDVIYL
jgi:hypothetical protein